MTGLDIFPIVPGRIVGKDRNGVELCDGDRVMDFNALPTPSPAVIRRGPKHNPAANNAQEWEEIVGEMLFAITDHGEKGMGYSGCTPDDPKYGVEKI